VIKKQPPAKRTPWAQEQRPPPATQPFNATPRFTFSSTPRPTPTQNLPTSTPSATRYLTPARQIPNPENVIENIVHSSDSPLRDSIETGDRDIDLGYLSGDDDYNVEERIPKRRRLSSSSELLDVEHQEPEAGEYYEKPPDSSLSILSSPPAPRRLVSATAPRFLVSTPASSSTLHGPQDIQPVFLKPSRFRPPDPAKQAHADPLPDQFSPHRRGQKYLAGGLAAEVRDWFVNFESAIPVASAQRTREDSWIANVVVDESSGTGRTGMTMIRGRQTKSDAAHAIVDDSGVVKVILAGEGAETGLTKGSSVEIGETIGIKGPVWEIVIGGEKWGVGIEWKVLTS
jgi:hypothetical protein